jgi:hypothetical protein
MLYIVINAWDGHLLDTQKVMFVSEDKQKAISFVKACIKVISGITEFNNQWVENSYNKSMDYPFGDHFYIQEIKLNQINPIDFTKSLNIKWIRPSDEID